MRELLGDPGTARTGGTAGAAADGGSESGGRRRATAAWDAVDPTVAVAEALAEAEGLDVTELPPLFASVDTEALNALLRSAPDGRVSFSHLGHEVVVSGRGEVEVRGMEDD